MSAGFFGKLQSHGDFVGRRLPPAMQQPFDAWLQAALLGSREQLGAQWVGVWAGSPVWRFALGPGVCGPQAWLGVMMPSADRVGRCFPLVIASAPPVAPSLESCLGPLGGWFGQLEELVLSSLDPAFHLDVFDAALLATARPHGPPDAGTPPFTFSPAVAHLEAGRMPPLARASMAGTSAWWTDGSEHVSPSLARCMGMPAAAAFGAMLDGDWSARGWHRT